MQPTETKNPDYFHKVVDCQWACPAHTPVPEYIRMIAAGRYGDAYMVNWESNVFPGILGRTCDRPCEPACRRGRVEDENLAKPEPVAICRLKRVAADLKDPEEIATENKQQQENQIQRQAHRLRRRRAGLAHRRARPRAARLRGHRVRPGPQARRHDLDADPALPPARERDRRRGGLHPEPGRRVQAEKDRLDESPHERGLRRHIRGLRARRAGATWISLGARKARRTSTSASTGSPRCPSATPRRSASASSCWAAATPRWIAAAPRSASAATTSR